MSAVEPIPAIRLLLVEDDLVEAEIISHALGSAETAFEVRRAARMEEVARTMEDGWRPHVAIVDLNLPDSAGVDTVRRVRAVVPDTPVLVFTGDASPETTAAATAAGAATCLPKAHTDARGLATIVLSAVQRDEVVRAAFRRGHQLERIVETLHDGVVIVDRDGIVRFANAAAGALFGRAPAELVGTKFGLPSAAGAPAGVTIPRASGPVEAELRVAECEWEGRPAILASLHDLTEARLLQRAQTARSVNRDFVRDLLAQLKGNGSNGSSCRRTGRSVGEAATGATLEERLADFAAMGMGSLALVTDANGRYVFAGRGLLDGEPHAHHATCELTLGFLEGCVRAISGQPALGAETECESMGAARCLFVVRSVEPGS